MTDRQQRFIEEYLVDFNATQAAIRAGYSAASARNTGSRMLKLPDIARAVRQARDALSAQAGLNAERVLWELQCIAFSRITDYLELRDGELTVRDTRSLTEQSVAALAGIKHGARGVELRLYDKQSALESLAKRLNLYGAGDDEENARRMAGLRELFTGIADAAVPDGAEGRTDDDVYQYSIDDY